MSDLDDPTVHVVDLAFAPSEPGRLAPRTRLQLDLDWLWDLGFGEPHGLLSPYVLALRAYWRLHRPKQPEGQARMRRYASHRRAGMPARVALARASAPRGR